MKIEFHERALSIVLDDQGEKKEVVSVGYYSVVLDDGHGGTVLVEQSASMLGSFFLVVAVLPSPF